jgi:hypothetical protein
MFAQLDDNTRSTQPPLPPIGWCRQCGRQLKAPKSISRGGGPVCAAWLARMTREDTTRRAAS